MDEQPSELIAVCHVRAPMLFEPVDAQIETLRACECEGTVDSLLLRSWPKEVALAGETPHQEVVETVERFDRWADSRGVSIRPPFREREFTSQVTGETKGLLVTPVCCLEVYTDDELVGVFPHSRNGETYTAADAIAKLRAGELPEPLGEPVEPASAGSAGGDRCPECGDELLNGQGVYACQGCDWTETRDADGGYGPLVDPDRPVPSR